MTAAKEPTESAKVSSRDAADGEGLTVSRPRVRAAFGAENRLRLITRFLADSTDPPWRAVYKLILWVDKTTGLAHCYESDKTQPGKNWHLRALRFHDWLATNCDSSPAAVGEHIDWLFRHVAEDYAHFMVEEYRRLLVRAKTQRASFADRDFPEPGDDPGIVQVVREVLGPHLTGEPTAEQWRELTRRVRDLIAVENKRKNIVGEGFEDVLAQVLKHADTAHDLDLKPRRVLHDVPGFANRRQNEKTTKVDLAIVSRRGGHRTLVTAKWSTRADREEQFKTDFQRYLSAESLNAPFSYVMVTNEFDPARLKRACELMAGNSHMLNAVVHIAPEALRAVYGPAPEGTMGEVLAYIDKGRILGLDAWIESLVSSA